MIEELAESDRRLLSKVTRITFTGRLPAKQRFPISLFPNVLEIELIEIQSPEDLLIQFTGLRLNQLAFIDCAVSREAIDALTKIAEIKSLVFSGIYVPENENRQWLQPLSKVIGLRDILISGYEVSEATRDELAETVPNVAVKIVQLN